MSRLTEQEQVPYDDLLLPPDQEEPAYLVQQASDSRSAPLLPPPMLHVRLRVGQLVRVSHRRVSLPKYAPFVDWRELPLEFPENCNESSPVRVNRLREVQRVIAYPRCTCPARSPSLLFPIYAAP